MRTSEFIRESLVDEMALTQYQTIGDFEKPGSFRGVDKRLVPHPKTKIKAEKFFSKVPYDIRLFFTHIPGISKVRETGCRTANDIQQIFGPDVGTQILTGSEDAITIVFVNNQGDSKVMMTPWIMAHRFGHALAASDRWKAVRHDAWIEAEKHFFTAINNMLEEYYSKTSDPRYTGLRGVVKWDMSPEYNALFNAIGTQKSSRTNQIKRPYEFMYEAFAQYLGTGQIKFNPLPTNLGYGAKAWGKPSKYLNIKPEHNNPRDLAAEADMLARDMEYMFDSVLASAVGNVYVM